MTFEIGENQPSCVLFLEIFRCTSSPNVNYIYFSSSHTAETILVSHGKTDGFPKENIFSEISYDILQTIVISRIEMR